ncbi:MAG: hypothetical protein RLZZ333_828, partial [Bacteroidota bacterium]
MVLKSHFLFKIRINCIQKFLCIQIMFTMIYFVSMYTD